MTNELDALLVLAWNQLWQVTVAALVVAALVGVFGRKRPHLAYLLWMLVIAKCLTPPLWSSPTGLFSWLRAETHQVASTLSEPALREPIIGGPTNATRDVSIARASANPAASDTSLLPARVAPRDASRTGRDSAETVPQLLSTAPVAARRTDYWSIGLAFVWGCGAIVCSVVVITRRALCVRAVRRFGRVADPDLQRAVAELSQQLGVRRQVSLVVSSKPFGPAIFGLFRPTILLPAVLTGELFAKRLRPILAHELIHVRRGDTLLGTLQLAAQIIWWFHPLVWWANRELTRERERCCDEEAVAGLACDPSEYAQALIDVLRSKRQLKPLFAQPGVRPVDITARRLEHIMQSDRGFHARTPKSCWIVGGLVAAMLLPGSGLVIELGTAGAGDGRESRETTASTPDWPQYGGGPQRNNVSREKNLPASWNIKTGENIKWTAKLGTSAYSSPVVGGGKVFIGTNNGAAYSDRFPEGTDASCLLCFDANSGEFLWQHANEKLATGRVHDWPEIGICSTSLIEGSRVWYVNNRNEIVCLDLDGFHDNENDGPLKDEPATALGDADVVWKVDMMSALGVSQHNQAICSMTAVDDLLLVSTSHGTDESHLDNSPGAPSFVAVKKDSGQLVWQHELPRGNLLHGQWSSPAYGVIGGVGQAIFAGGDGWLYSFDVNAIKQGKSELLWKFDCNPKESVWIMGGRGTRNNAIAIPVISGDRVFMAVGRDPEHGEGNGHVWCVDATKRGDISAELVFNEGDPNRPIPHKRRQAAESEKGDVVKPNPNSGVVWDYHEVDRNGDGKIEFEESMHRSFSSVVIHEGLAVIPDFSGLVHCLNAETGQPYWSYDMLSSVWGTPLIADGKIYIGDEDGDVAIFELSRELNLLAEINVELSVYTTIMAAGGTLYVPSQGRLLALENSSVRPTDTRPVASPRWLSARGNSANTGVSASELPSRLDSLWTFRTNTECSASPVVADGVAYVGDLVDSLYAIDMKTGRPRWTLKNESGFAASPLLVGKRLFAGDLDGTMHCVDARSGAPLWRFAAGTSISGSANAVDGLVVFGNEGGTIFAVEPLTGTLAWKTTVTTQLRSAPAIDGSRVVIAGCDKQMHVLEVNSGKTLSSTDIASPTIATPAVRNGFAFVGTEGGVLFCIELATGKVRWRFEHESISKGVRGSVAVTDDHVIVAGRGKTLIAIAVGTGELLWQFHAKSRFDSSPVIVDRHVMLGSSDGRLYVIEIATGDARLVYETGSSMTGSVAVADGRFVLTTDDGKIICLGDPSDFRGALPTASDSPANPNLAEKFGLLRIESVGGEALQVKSRQQGTSPEFSIRGRCRLTFGDGERTIIAESDAAVIRGWTLEITDLSQAKIYLEGDVVLTTGESEVRADSVRYDASSRQFQFSGDSVLQWPQVKPQRAGGR